MIITFWTIYLCATASVCWDVGKWHGALPGLACAGFCAALAGLIEQLWFV